MGSKGQIVIPKNARDTFDMKEGNRLLQHSISTQDAKATHRLVRRCVESYLPVKSATILTPNAGASSITNRFSRAFIFTHFHINGK
ncbi:MAG: AbrB/MazE/SpoVT family DNA-binding domain-containing protein [Eubacterium sp.]